MSQKTLPKNIDPSRIIGLPKSIDPSDIILEEGIRQGDYLIVPYFMKKGRGEVINGVVHIYDPINTSSPNLAEIANTGDYSEEELWDSVDSITESLSDEIVFDPDELTDEEISEDFELDERHGGQSDDFIHEDRAIGMEIYVDWLDGRESNAGKSNLDRVEEACDGFLERIVAKDEDSVGIVVPADEGSIGSIDEMLAEESAIEVARGDKELVVGGSSVESNPIAEEEYLGHESIEAYIANLSQRILSNISTQLRLGLKESMNFGQIKLESAYIDRSSVPIIYAGLENHPFFVSIKFLYTEQDDGQNYSGSQDTDQKLNIVDVQIVFETSKEGNWGWTRKKKLAEYRNDLSPGSSGYYDKRKGVGKYNTFYSYFAQLSIEKRPECSAKEFDYDIEAGASQFIIETFKLAKLLGLTEGKLYDQTCSDPRYNLGENPNTMHELNRFNNPEE